MTKTSAAGSTKDLAIFGFGTVGEGVYSSIQEKAAEIKAVTGTELHICAVLVQNVEKERNVAAGTVVTDNPAEILANPDLDTVVEVTPDAKTAYPLVKESLERGISVVTANKELVMMYGTKLHETADRTGASFLYEAAVAAGIPVLTSIRETLRVNKITRVEAILNGTSHFMLTEMENRGISFAEALSEAQDLGYAEAVPDKDIDGWDAWYKAIVLARWIYGQNTPIDVYDPEGIRGIQAEELWQTRKQGKCLKPAVTLEKQGKSVQITVSVRELPLDHPLASVQGVMNGVYIESDLMGPLTFQGPGAGKWPTASSIVEDVVRVYTNKYIPGSFDVTSSEHPSVIV
ncbi:homoserine dehydrogenase [Salisediminibacterium halotolerans]|uniref:Homoserine dehydrogenase n=1 Tax=Salisediminibacterium halotolerans TaxID=517425 RepID=A0A1H9VNI5_9BACI|nr:homoserine dehydrogenase [Salisediminibacterium haloalkalitolerans]SES23266.1 homoserine dehydrogenase [Salisediminibacterium haloalkalitolerans]